MGKVSNNSKKEPEIGDIIKIICATSYGNEEIIGRLAGYQGSELGKCELGENQYVKLEGHKAIYMPSIIDWEILKETKKGE